MNYKQNTNKIINEECYFKNGIKYKHLRQYIVSTNNLYLLINALIKLIKMHNQKGKLL